jgi:hypothetical protein
VEPRSNDAEGVAAPGPRSAISSRAASLTAAAAGAALAAALALGTMSCGSGFEEREEFREWAPAAEVAEWEAEWKRRAEPHAKTPDPRGEGELVVGRWWLSRASYEVEVRRRGHRVVVSTHGIDEQTLGGGWTAVGEGTITGDPKSFSGAEARISWSCLGIRHRSASDGIAKLSFSADGERVVAIYSAYETWLDEAPYVFNKAYGERARGPRPPRGTLRGQIPYRDGLTRHAPDAKVTVSGRVRTTEGAPVPRAAVRLKGRPGTTTISGPDGAFALTFRGREAPWGQPICAGAIGHANGETVLFTGDATTDVTIELRPLDPKDHANYRWVHPSPDHDPDDAMSCGTCHSWQYTEWLGSRHARSADNGHVLWDRERMRRRAPDAPDDCAACHQPAEAAASGRLDYVPRGVLASNHCDFCHKVSRADLTGGHGPLGRLTLSRPDPAGFDVPGSIHRVFGPAPDVTYAWMGASYAPHLSTSWLCAGCHEGRGKLSTFTEWREWAGSRPAESVKECQGCHMPAATTRTVEGAKIDLFAWESLHRGAEQVHSHAFLGASPTLAREALDVKVETTWDEAARAWRAAVRVTNVGAGHRIPTGTPCKHVLVGVWATQGDRALRMTASAEDDAASVPTAPGTRALEGGDWASARTLFLGVRDRVSKAPVTDWWVAAPDFEDRRLAPGATRALTAWFAPAGEDRGAAPRVEVRVIHRRGDAGPADTPWPLHVNDAPPQVEWLRIVR